jgi:hypothetical protein
LHRVGFPKGSSSGVGVGVVGVGREILDGSPYAPVAEQKDQDKHLIGWFWKISRIGLTTDEVVLWFGKGINP